MPDQFVVNIEAIIYGYLFLIFRRTFYFAHVTIVVFRKEVL